MKKGYIGMLFLALLILAGVAVAKSSSFEHPEECNPELMEQYCPLDAVDQEEHTRMMESGECSELMESGNLDAMIKMMGSMMGLGSCHEG